MIAVGLGYIKAHGPLYSTDMETCADACTKHAYVSATGCTGSDCWSCVCKEDIGNLMMYSVDK